MSDNEHFNRWRRAGSPSLTIDEGFTVTFEDGRVFNLWQGVDYRDASTRAKAPEAAALSVPRGIEGAAADQQERHAVCPTA